MSQSTPPPLEAILGLAMLAALAGKRTGPTSTNELLTPGCRHKREAKRLDASLAAIEETLEYRLKALGDPHAVMLREGRFLEDLLDRIRMDRKPSPPEQERRVHVPGEETIQDKAAAFTAAANPVPGHATVEVAQPIEEELTDRQLQGVNRLGTALAKAAGTLLDTFNDELPPGFVAHITIARKDP